jgi:NDP-sugar pyrophosphorylase family protein
MVQFHRDRDALATLAVQKRETSRHLRFDMNGKLRGRAKRGETDSSAGASEALAFSGVHVISPRLLSMMTEQGAFSIIDTYVRLAAQGEKIFAFRADDYRWRDLGNPESLKQAEADVRKNILET